MALVSLEVESIRKGWEEKEQTFDQIAEPYPNEHSCRFVEPQKGARYRRVNDKFRIGGKRVDVIYMIIGGANSTNVKIQAMRFPTSIWSADAARKYCSSKGGSFHAATG